MSGTNPGSIHFESGRTLEEVQREIQEVYCSDARPWVIGYSGGKDSTTTLQLVWNAVAQLPPEMRRKTVHVITSDTLVETPVIVDYINQTIARINQFAAVTQLPFYAEKVRPAITKSFWVNLIGRGYSAPQQKFRWCTDRLKIQPANSFIVERISRYGEVVLVLGVRSSESATRAQVMSLHRIKGTLLSRHSHFPRAYVYTPIRDFTLNDVWDYLLSVPSPWGNDNKYLATLYRYATGECPLVVDDTTPSCGNSRFGCWVCTVVTRDKSVEALIAAGEKWMQPLLEIRNLLASTQDPKKKALYREYKRISGVVSFKSDGSGVIARGPYKLDFCKELLTRVLQAQEDVRRNGPDPNMQLILPEEIHEIRRIWRTERGDWADSVPGIYIRATGSRLDWVQDDLGAFSEKESRLLEEICKTYGVPARLVTKLLDAEIQLQGMRRRASVFARIEQILAEEWRTEEELIEGVKSEDSRLGSPKGRLE